MKGLTKAILFCGAAAFVALASPAHARDVNAELAAKKASQEALVKKAQELVTQVDGLKNKLVNTARVVRETESQVANSDKALKDLQAQQTATLKNLYREHDQLGGLVAAASKFNRTPLPQMLLQSNPLDAERASLVMKTLIPALNEHAEALKARINEMARIERDIAAQRAAQTSQLKTLSKQKDELGELLQERQLSYKQTENDRKAQEKEVAALAKEAKSLADLERRLQEQADREAARNRAAASAASVAHSNVPLPANMVQPVSGTLATGFGETDELGARSEGLTYAALPGATVVTPLAGKVKFAGPFQKYKQILIIEHAGGYHSLIAGLGRIDTVVGAHLAAGEPVGAAGSTAQDSKIYYELRRGGDPVNPRNSMVAQRKQDKS